uniref:Cytochrome b5-related protein n=1 Tax=Anoplophora glabripennis TaxID=217634 RepID=V5GUG9_ANOGL
MACSDKGNRHHRGLRGPPLKRRPRRTAEEVLREESFQEKKRTIHLQRRRVRTKLLKKEIQKELKNVPKQASKNSVLFIDALLFLLFLFSVLTVRYWSYGLGVIAGVLLGMVTIASHNFIHRKNNFRMYYFQFSLQQVREFRISHILSHHLHTNTIDDLEMSLLEPLLEYLPINKTPLKRYGQALVIAPLVWLTFFHAPFVKRYKEALSCKGKNLRITDLSSFLLPLAMYLFGGRSFLDAFWMWNYVLVVGALHFGFVGLHAAHHHPDIFHDGDVPRSTTDYDWGISQLDAVMDRKEISGSHFLVLTNFGDHCLHHMFPTLDHGTLDYLYPVFKKVLNDFDLDLRMVSQWDTITGGFQQLVKVEPNTAPPDLKKYKKK